MSVELSEDDVGKELLDGDGDRVGYVAEVQGGTAYVDPEADVDDELWTKLDWGATSRDSYPLRHDAIDEVTEEAVRLGRKYA